MKMTPVKGSTWKDWSLLQFAGGAQGVYGYGRKSREAGR